MTPQQTNESLIEEIHRVRRQISDRFQGNLVAIAEDAAKRLAASDCRIWQPKVDISVSGTSPKLVRTEQN